MSSPLSSSSYPPPSRPGPGPLVIGSLILLAVGFIIGAIAAGDPKRKVEGVATELSDLRQQLVQLKNDSARQQAALADLSADAISGAKTVEETLAGEKGRLDQAGARIDAEKARIDQLLGKLTSTEKALAAASAERAVLAKDRDVLRADVTAARAEVEVLRKKVEQLIGALTGGAKP